MKINKNICIDHELSLKLKEEHNASQLINDLLWKHFNDKPKDGMTNKERIQWLTDLKEVKLIERDLKLAKEKFKQKHGNYRD